MQQNGAQVQSNPLLSSISPIPFLEYTFLLKPFRVQEGVLIIRTHKLGTGRLASGGPERKGSTKNRNFPMGCFHFATNHKFLGYFSYGLLPIPPTSPHSTFSAVPKYSTYRLRQKQPITDFLPQNLMNLITSVSLEKKEKKV